MSIEAMKQEIVQAIRAAILRSKLNNIRTAPKDGQTVGDLAVRVESLELLCEGVEGEHYDQTSLELCNECGWKAVIPGDGCLVCARQKAKPTAWMYDFLSDNRDEVIRDWMTQDYADIKRENGFNVRPLYTAPREWVGLTTQEIEDEWERLTGHSIFGGDRSAGRSIFLSGDEVIHYTQAIEAKLKEKNYAG